MGKKVKVDHQALADAVQQMNDARGRYHEYVEDGFKTELEDLDKMNSDFVDILTRVLEISKKWNLETLDKNMEDYIKEADRIREKIKEADETLAGQEGKG